MVTPVGFCEYSTVQAADCIAETKYCNKGISATNRTIMDALSVSVSGLLQDPKLVYLHERTVVFASGNGLLLWDLDTGAQVNHAMVQLAGTSVASLNK